MGNPDDTVPPSVELAGTLPEPDKSPRSASLPPGPSARGRSRVPGPEPSSRTPVQLGKRQYESIGSGESSVALGRVRVVLRPTLGPREAPSVTPPLVTQRSRGPGPERPNETGLTRSTRNEPPPVQGIRPTPVPDDLRPYRIGHAPRCRSLRPRPR